VSHDAHSNVEDDSSPQRLADDDDDDDDDCVRRVHGTSAVTSRSGSPAVDSTTADYCTVTADARTPTTSEQRSNEPTSLLVGCQPTSLDGAVETPCSADKAPRHQQNVFSMHDDEVDQPATILHPADDTATLQTTSVLAATADTVNVCTTPPSDTQVVCLLVSLLITVKI